MDVNVNFCPNPWIYSFHTCPFISRLLRTKSPTTFKYICNPQTKAEEIYDISPHKLSSQYQHSTLEEHLFWLFSGLYSNAQIWLRPDDAYMRHLTSHHWFRTWLVAWSAPSHYLNQFWNKDDSNLRNSEILSKIFIQELKISSAKWQQFCLGLNVLMNGCFVISVPS